MELSLLFARRHHSMATGGALPHHVRRRLMLGICVQDRPRLVIGALAFGHLPTIFVPITRCRRDCQRGRGEKNPRPPALRRGQGDPGDLLEAESRSHHAAGTCTFPTRHRQHQSDADGIHGAAPGARASPDTPAHCALTRAAVARVL